MQLGGVDYNIGGLKHLNSLKYYPNLMKSISLTKIESLSLM